MKSKKEKGTAPKSTGKNIRFSDTAHQQLSDFCKEQGYNLGAFCEKGALHKMQTEIAKKS